MIPISSTSSVQPTCQLGLWSRNPGPATGLHGPVRANCERIPCEHTLFWRASLALIIFSKKLRGPVGVAQVVAQAVSPIPLWAGQPAAKAGPSTLGLQCWWAGVSRNSVQLLGSPRGQGLGSASKGEKGRDHYLPTISQSRYTGMLGLALLS